MSLAKQLFDGISEVISPQNKLFDLLVEPNKCPELAIWLENKRPNLNFIFANEKESPLSYVIRTSNIGALGLLLKYGADPNIYVEALEGTPLYFLFFISDSDFAVQMITLLRQYGATHIANYFDFQLRLNKSKSVVEYNTDNLAQYLTDPQSGYHFRKKVDMTKLPVRLKALLAPIPQCQLLIDLNYYYRSLDGLQTLLHEFASSKWINIWVSLFPIFCEVKPGFKLESKKQRGGTLLHIAADNKRGNAGLIIKSVLAYARTYFNPDGNTPLAYLPFISEPDANQCRAIDVAMQGNNPSAFDALLEGYMEAFSLYRQYQPSDQNVEQDDFSMLSYVRDKNNETVFAHALQHPNPHFLYSLIRHNFLGIFDDKNNLLHCLILHRYLKGDLKECVSQCLIELSQSEHNVAQTYLQQENAHGLTPLTYFLQLHQSTQPRMNEQTAMEIVNIIMNCGAVLPLTAVQAEQVPTQCAEQTKLSSLLLKRAAVAPAPESDTSPSEADDDSGDEHTSTFSEDEPEEEKQSEASIDLIPDCILQADKKDRFSYLRLLVETTKKPEHKAACLPLLETALNPCEPSFTYTLMLGSIAVLLLGLSVLSFGAAVLCSAGLGVSLFPFIAPLLTQFNLILGITTCVLGVALATTGVYGLVQQIPKCKLINEASKLIKDNVEASQVLAPHLMRGSQALGA